jgi:hypothetical protein
MNASRAAAGTRPLWPAPLAGVVALLLYGQTLAPGLTWAHYAADGGDLLAAALTRGVPHPSGYPAYQLLLRAVLALYPGAPARAGNWLSALCAAAAVALFADLAGRMLMQIASRADAHSAANATGESNWHADDAGTADSADHVGWAGARPVAALAAALAWAASPILWGQAVVTEVYTPSALVVVGLLWLLWRWRETVEAGARGRRWLIGAGAVFGLGLGVHLTLLLMAPGMAVWLWAGRRAAGRSLARVLPAALAVAALGLAVYTYLPLAAAGDPPVNWGDPRTPAQFWALVSGQVYRSLPFSLPLLHLPARLGAWSGEAVRQFGGPWGAVLALIGLWRLDRRLHAWWQATLLIAAAYSIYAIGYNSPDSFVYLIPVWCVAALWLAAGLDRLGEVAMTAIHGYGTHARVIRGPVRGFVVKSVDGRLLKAILIVLLLAVPAVSAARFWRENDLSDDREAEDFVSRALDGAAPDAIILTSGDGRTFALWYAVYGLGQRPDVTPVNVSLASFDWYRRTLAEAHPDLAPALGGFDAVQPAAWLEHAPAERPLYRAETLALPLPGYAEEPAGSLVRLTKVP